MRTDYSKILEELGDLGLQPISDEVVDESLNLATGISDDIVTELRKGVLAAGRYLSKQVIDKSKRDGRLIVILIQYRKNRRESGGTGAVVSSSSLLKQVCKNRKDLVGPAEAVMPLGAIAYLLALAPRAQMSVISLKKLLFTPGMTERLTSLQRTALRIIYDSTEFSLPFSRRFALQREMYSKMTRIAVEQGQPVSDLIKEIETKGADREELLKEVVYEAIDRIAWSQSERRVQELENEVRRLQEELAKSRKRK